MAARVCPCPRREPMDGERKGKIWKHGDACRKRAIRAGTPAGRIEAARRAANPDKARTHGRSGLDARHAYVAVEGEFGRHSGQNVHAGKVPLIGQNAGWA